MTIYEALDCSPIGQAAGIKLHKADKDKLPEGWLVSEKLDGVSGVFVAGAFYSLTGKPLSNTHLIENPFADSDLVIFGEITSRSLSLEELSGVLNPNTKKEVKDVDLYFSPFDAVTVEEYRIGSTATSYVNRLARLREVASSTVTQYRYNLDGARELFDYITYLGGEGVVFRDPNAGWFRGKRTRTVLKLVKEPRFDLKVLDIEEGTGKRAGTVGRVILEFKGNPIKADLGKGFPDDRRQEIWDNRQSYIGCIADVKALAVSSTGKSLRLPKIENMRRLDKEVSDE